MSELEESGQGCHYDTSSDKKHQSRNAPDYTVDLAVYLRKTGQKTIHCFYPPKSLYIFESL